ncbi:MerR family transcriptional regulator [Sorangium sp. So ce693]|uniref:MerR family transcriptional regulator n=1 Tax=Sorangium sp. So ce693 TaxID=3133318 RepID=UPI003F5D6705
METRQLKEAGLLTSTAVARMLGIRKTTLRRIEGQLFAPAPRQGIRKMRVFTPEQVDVLRKTRREKTRLSRKPELVGLEEVTRRAACSMQTICRCLRESPRHQFQCVHQNRTRAGRARACQVS